ncbi:hypothetical protein OEZ49_00115 [Ruegeria sp. WL0004]|uniref:Aromatic-ring-hydroxylating dioxygenase alpha subunit C-terminal domain-containing protein n=1 Tax=Ruegeria marisflavi TaxID=2984152 RepID=A0ABT2WMI7_9RHOB|nr:SRPBCC family protein [Ruegeria sp. WL0004]MCU9836155.1 hypothetical protein [Ruegeria sp. WL0004]
MTERFGWIWVVPRPGEYYDFESFLDPIAPDLSWVGAEHMQVMQSDEILCRANWKTIVEGGIEAYHFKVAHADTIGPHFLDNLSTYQMFGPHMRSVLARSSLPRLRELPQDEWDIRADTNILYSLFPIDQLLLTEDHLAWVHLAPLSAGETLIRLSTVAPRDGMPGREAHWARNHRITCTTLTEDFVIAEGVQAGISSGANDVLTFGRYEGALHSFAQQVAAALNAA